MNTRDEVKKRLDDVAYGSPAALSYAVSERRPTDAEILNSIVLMQDAIGDSLLFLAEKIDLLIEGLT